MGSDRKRAGIWRAISMLLSRESSRPSEPTGYSKNVVNAILDDYRIEQPSGGDNAEKPLVIAIMNESFSDLNVLGSMK